MFYLTPWSNVNAEAVRVGTERWVQKDNRNHGLDQTLSEGGFPSYGPVSEAKLELETNRLYDITRSLRVLGYDRSYGECKFLVIKMGDEIRMIAYGGGYHRTAGAAALGLKTIAGNFCGDRVIFDIDDVGFWPNVRSGLWTKSEAVKYVEHLFGFDSVSWARRYNLA